MSRKGFTLIEVMICVAILGILVAIFVPKIQQAVRAPKNPVVLNMANRYAIK